MHSQYNLPSILKYSLIAASIALVSCGGGGSDSTAPTPNPVDEPVASGLLVPVETQEQLVNSFRQGFTQTIAATDEVAFDNDAMVQAPVAEAISGDSASSRSFTTTYTLERGIDEHDAVKYDGSHLFIAPSRSMDCCFIVDDFALEDDVMIATDAIMIPEDGSIESDEHSIRILATDPEQAGATQVGSIAVDSNRSIEGLYIDNSQLVSINSSGWWGLYGDAFISPRTWQGQSTGLEVYNISDTANPTLDWQIEIEGGFISSRKKGDTVYLVARHTPSAEGLHYYPSDDEMAAENIATLDALSIEDILPKVSINGSESPLLAATDCSIADSEHSSSPSAAYTPTMTLLIAIDLGPSTDGQPVVSQAVCYMEPTSGVYVSENAIYLTQAEYSNSEARTFVHKYSIGEMAGEEISYSGSGVVQGTINGSSSDFRINEYADHLRLVTTEFIDDSSDRLDHQLFVLKQSATAAELNVVATLPNEQRPAEIGKPNEDLYGVRFLGDTLYLVTFERTDPLYVLDLSTATEPMIAGELSVPGFSDFLHPVSSDLLLGLGQDENRAVKLELFNVASIDSPYSLGTVTLAPEASWSHSEARYNHHAFTYQPISESTDRFSIPLSLGLYDETEGVYREEDRLYLFEIDSKDVPELSSIIEVGHLSAKSQWWDSLQRSVFHGDAVYFINGSSVWSTMWNNPTEQNGPL
ncbi:MAG: beta-propeller domain-containing protein [Porticoccaceae bacterium]|nr:beta-propeller domain-containing protein [Porticoccaceae bacterium]